MLACTFDLSSIAPVSFSRAVQSELREGESHNDHEERTWRERMHTDNHGEVFIPPMALKNCMSEVAKFLSEKIPGKGNQAWTKHFETGVMCMEPLMLGISVDDVDSERLFVPADGRRGGPKRVWKRFPIIREWSASGRLYITDDSLIENIKAAKNGKTSKVEEYLEKAGRIVGLGRFRPRNNGFYGRFQATSFAAAAYDAAAA